MKTYIDNNYLVANDTIIAYTGAEFHIDVPPIFGKIKVTQIGDDAFSEHGSVESIKLPYGINSIGETAFRENQKLKKIEIPGSVKNISNNAFEDCNELCEIIWYNVELSKKEYNDLKKWSSSDCDSINVAHYIPSFLEERGFAGSFESCLCNAATVVPISIPILFRRNIETNGYTSQDLFSKLEHISFYEDEAIENENDAFINLIQSPASVSLSLSAETESDRFVKMACKLLKNRTYIFTFDDKKTIQYENKVYITATIKFGYFFWQSSQKVVYDNKDYYIYSRHYLSDDPKLEYMREDAAVYHNNKIVTDRTEAQCVYGKYKLMSIL